MSQALNDHFVREAGDYVAELERLLTLGDVPDAERVLRLARGIRGSAQLAGVQGVAEVAARLEGAARFVLEGRIPWSAELRERAVRTVADLKALVPAVGRWGAAEDARAGEALARWGGFAEIAATPPAVPQGEAVFSFVRGELEVVAATLERAVARLRAAPRERAPVEEILRAIRALLGVADADPLEPVMEVLHGLDEMLRAIAAEELPVEGERLEFLEVALAAVRAARDGLARGADLRGADPAFVRFRALRERLGIVLAEDTDTSVVPIRALFFDDAGPHVVASPVAPVAPPGATEPPPQVLEFLRLEATALLDRADALLAEFGPDADLAAGRIGQRLVGLVLAVRELAGAYDVTSVVHAAERAVAELRAAGSSEDARAALADLRAALAGTATAAAAAAEEDAVPVESLLLRGERALSEALALRGDIERLVAAAAAPGAELRERLDELWDLLELARTPEPA